MPSAKSPSKSSSLSPTRCPTCGSDLAGRSICPRCGTLASVEYQLTRLRSRARLFVDRRLSSWPQKLAPHHFLWACAFVPLFLLPPLVSLVVSLRSMWRRDASAASDEWIALISAVNLIVSCWILYKFHFSPYELVLFVTGIVKHWLQLLFHIAPTQPSGPRLLPA